MDESYTPTPDRQPNTPEEQRMRLMRAGQKAGKLSAALFAQAAEPSEMNGDLYELAEKILALSAEEDTIEPYAPEDVLGTTVDALDVSIRTQNVLKRQGINLIDDLLPYSYADFRRFQNLSRAGFDELRRELTRLGVMLRET
ncbi:hypothetical protein FWF74_00080 [Candidatus Saccharibacteria bacterium]|nr:hypothetical protein [Candidatus Saccharibacteria bacterium]MCL1962977.1 hypothetical protein [Candidatus Saccharibacteria bacterium]